MTGTRNLLKVRLVEKLKVIFKEPLFYFFLLGVIVFGVHAFVKCNSQGGKHRYQVQITSSDVDWLRSRWNKLMNRRPTAQELQGLIESMIREEILFREAVAMGLDEKDSVVRRRLAQKMELLFKDLADMAQPTGAQLTDYFTTHEGRYRIGASISFTHIFFSSDKRAQTAQTDSKAVLEKLRQENTPLEEALSFGDPFMQGVSFRQQSPEQIARIFGATFPETMDMLEPNQWHGPVRSSYGWHAVYITKLVPSSMPDFQQVRAKVEIDYISQNRDKVNRQSYKDISSQYSILVEDLPYELETK